MNRRAIVVTGATGAQGGAVIDALSEAEIPLRAMVRDLTSPAARALRNRGVELVRGDFDDAASLDEAVSGALGVFSMQLPPTPADPESEVRAGTALVRAARAAEVDIFVHTSVARAGDHEAFAGWRDGRWWREYWLAKATVNGAVRDAGFTHWTVLKPAFLMDNFLPPKVGHMFPSLQQGILDSAMGPNSRLDLVSAAGVGAFAAAAFTDPRRWHQLDIPLAAESLTMTQIATTLREVTGQPITVRHLNAANATAAGIPAGVVESQLWATAEGYQVDLSAVQVHGVKLQSFARWAHAHRSDFLVR